MRKVLSWNLLVAIEVDVCYIDLPLEYSVQICEGHMGNDEDKYHCKNTRQLDLWWIQREVIYIDKRDDMTFLYSLI